MAENPYEPPKSDEEWQQPKANKSGYLWLVFIFFIPVALIVGGGIHEVYLLVVRFLASN